METENITNVTNETVEEIDQKELNELIELEKTVPVENPVEVVDDDHLKYIVEGGALAIAFGGVIYGTIKIAKFVKRKLIERKQSEVVVETETTEENC